MNLLDLKIYKIYFLSISYGFIGEITFLQDSNYHNKKKVGVT